MKNTLEEFRLLFNNKMEEFIDWRLRAISYQTVAYAQNIVNSYNFSDDESLKLIHREVSHFLDNFEKNLTNTRPILRENIDTTNNSNGKKNIEEET